MRRIINPLILFVAILMIASCKNQDKIQKTNNPLPEWAFGGFIRAEVVAYDDLIACGSHNAAKEKGLVRLEGKDYVVKDGDIMLFRFNV